MKYNYGACVAAIQSIVMYAEKRYGGWVLNLRDTNFQSVSSDYKDIIIDTIGSILRDTYLAEAFGIWGGRPLTIKEVADRHKKSETTIRNTIKKEKNTIVNLLHQGELDIVFSLVHNDSLIREAFARSAKYINAMKDLDASKTELNELDDCVCLEYTSLTTRACNALARNGINTVGDIRAKIEREGLASLKKLRGCGRLTLQEVSEKIIIPAGIADSEKIYDQLLR